MPAYLFRYSFQCSFKYQPQEWSSFVSWSRDALSLFSFHHLFPIAGTIQGLRPANERRRYFATMSLIGWVQASNQPCNKLPSITASPWFSPALASWWWEQIPGIQVYIVHNAVCPNSQSKYSICVLLQQENKYNHDDIMSWKCFPH